MGAEARTVTPDTAYAISVWCGGVLVEEINAVDPSKSQPGINVPCGNEVKRASVGSAVVLKHDGTFDVV
jgi:hypothetical protein